jgi:hypothetical protein
LSSAEVPVLPITKAFGMPDYSKQAYDFALEVAKQLITLSTGILSLTVTFGKDVLKAEARRSARIVIVVAWLFFLVSIWFGVNHIQGLAGSLEWAAIESAARPRTMPDSMMAQEYLNTVLDTNSTKGKLDTVRAPLASAGVIVGDSAKEAARWQLYAFVIAVSLVAVYGVLLLFPASPPRKNEPKASPFE